MGLVIDQRDLIDVDELMLVVEARHDRHPVLAHAVSWIPNSLRARRSPAGVSAWMAALRPDLRRLVPTTRTRAGRLAAGRASSARRERIPDEDIGSSSM